MGIVDTTDNEVKYAIIMGFTGIICLSEAKLS